jgi:hypothetical protein
MFATACLIAHLPASDWLPLSSGREAAAVNVFEDFEGTAVADEVDNASVCPNSITTASVA